MAEKDVYVELAEHLDEAPIGAPLSEELLEILRILYTPEEAELAVRLPFSSQTLEELAEMLNRHPQELGEMLERMASKGTVFRKRRGDEVKYRLLPTLVGIAETPFWPGKDNHEVRRLAPLWTKYLVSGWGREIGEREVPLLRVVPVEAEIDTASEVLPYETVMQLVEGADYIAVAYCPCRQMKAYQGEGCNHERENCFHFGSMGEYIVDQGMGRPLSLEETWEKLSEAHREGLVFSVENYQGKIATLCCCCGCCCAFLQARKNLGFPHAISPSSYMAAVDTNSCTACATCEERCPVGAITLGDEEVARVDADLCLGCGVCVSSCSEGAVSLRRRAGAKPIPTLQEYIVSMLKD